MILDLSIVWLHGLGTMRQLVTFDHNSFHFLNHIQHFLSACLRGPFLPDTLCNPGSLDQLAAVPGRHQESHKWLPIEFILTGGGQMVRGGRFRSRVSYEQCQCPSAYHCCYNKAVRRLRHPLNARTRQVLANGTVLAVAWHNFLNNPATISNLKAWFF